MAKLEQAGIEFRPFFEPDRNNELTAVATGPIFGEQRQFFKKYNCLKVPTLLQEAV